MADPGPDRSDPAVRVRLRLEGFERRGRTARALATIALLTLALAGPFLARAITADPGATWGAIVGSILLVGCAVAISPWAWSPREREHHRLAAIWAEARSDAPEPTPWPRHVVWAEAAGDRVDLVRVTRAGSADPAVVPGSFSAAVCRSLDADDIAEAAIAMEALREEAALDEERARWRHEDAAAAAARKPLDDALRAIDETADAEQRRAEERMRAELAAQEAAERRAQAEAIARALRRP